VHQAAKTQFEGPSGSRAGFYIDVLAETDEFDAVVVEVVQSLPLMPHGPRHAIMPYDYDVKPTLPSICHELTSPGRRAFTPLIFSVCS
jgi:hypothetical protein